MTRSPPDNALIAGLVAGRSEAYAELYDRYGASLLRVSKSLLFNANEAEDAVQDLFVTLVRHNARFPLVIDWDAYLFAILRHSVARRIAKARTEQRHLRQLAEVGKQSRDGPPESDDALKAALAGLPQSQREIVILKIDGDLTFTQIADILNISPNTAASRYRYALEKLRKLLKEPL